MKARSATALFRLFDGTSSIPWPREVDLVVPASEPTQNARERNLVGAGIAGFSVVIAIWLLLKLGLSAWWAAGLAIPMTALVIHVAGLGCALLGSWLQVKVWMLIYTALAVYFVIRGDWAMWAGIFWLTWAGAELLALLCERSGWRFVTTAIITINIAAVLIAIASYLALGWPLWVVVPILGIPQAFFLLTALLPNHSWIGPTTTHFHPMERTVCLTIDDGPGEETSALLDLLDEFGAKAVFFLVGERIQKFPQVAEEIVKRGHLIGNHSQTHPQAWFWALGPKSLLREVSEASASIEGITGQQPRYFRPPVGFKNCWLQKVLESQGLEHLGWSIRGRDGVEGIEPQAVLSRLEDGLEPGAIILLHEGRRESLEILHAVLKRLQEKGLKTGFPS